MNVHKAIIIIVFTSFVLYYSYQVGSVVDRQNTSATTEKILDIPTAKMLETRIAKVQQDLFNSPHKAIGYDW